MKSTLESRTLNAFQTNQEYFNIIRAFHKDRGNAAIHEEECGLIDRFIGPHVLDAGCGEGSIARWIADRYPASSVVGVDCSGIALRMARSAFFELSAQAVGLGGVQHKADAIQ